MTDDRTKAIHDCWHVMEVAGIKRPWKTPAETSAALDVWSAVLADVEPWRLQTLTVAWLRSDAVKFKRWPMPGELLHALGDEAVVDDADDAWGEVLEILRMRGVSWCQRRIPDAASCSSYRLQLVEARRMALEAGDNVRVQEIERVGRLLPRGPDERWAAVYAGLVAVGGWQGLGRADDDQMAAHRASFRGAYRGTRGRARLTETEQRVVALLDGPRRPSLTGPH